MMKLTCLALLVAVAISWSHVDAKPRPISFAAPIAATITVMNNKKNGNGWGKREISSDELAAEIDQLSEESQLQLTKEIMAGILLMTVDSENSAEEDRLTVEFKKAADKNWDNLDDYAEELVKIYEEVTGRRPDERKK